MSISIPPHVHTTQSHASMPHNPHADGNDPSSASSTATSPTSPSSQSFTPGLLIRGWLTKTNHGIMSNQSRRFFATLTLGSISGPTGPVQQHLPTLTLADTEAPNASKKSVQLDASMSVKADPAQLQLIVSKRGNPHSYTVSFNPSVAMQQLVGIEWVLVAPNTIEFKQWYEALTMVATQLRERERKAKVEREEEKASAARKLLMQKQLQQQRQAARSHRRSSHQQHSASPPTPNQALPSSPSNSRTSASPEATSPPPATAPPPHSHHRSSQNGSNTSADIHSTTPVALSPPPSAPAALSSPSPTPAPPVVSAIGSINSVAETKAETATESSSESLSKSKGEEHSLTRNASGSHLDEMSQHRQSDADTSSGVFTSIAQEHDGDDENEESSVGVRGSQSASSAYLPSTPSSRRQSGADERPIQTRPHRSSSAADRLTSYSSVNATNTDGSPAALHTPSSSPPTASMHVPDRPCSQCDADSTIESKTEQKQRPSPSSSPSPSSGVHQPVDDESSPSLASSMDQRTEQRRAMSMDETTTPLPSMHQRAGHMLSRTEAPSPVTFDLNASADASAANSHPSPHRTPSPTSSSNTSVRSTSAARRSPSAYEFSTMGSDSLVSTHHGSSVSMGAFPSTASLQLTPDATKRKDTHTAKSSEKQAGAATNAANQAMKSRMYQKLFNLPVNEPLVEDYSCAIKKAILLHGRLYVSYHYVCFFSSIFSHKTSLIINMSDILLVAPAMVALLFDNSMKIFVQTGPLPIPKVNSAGQIVPLPGAPPVNMSTLNATKEAPATESKGSSPLLKPMRRTGSSSSMQSSASSSALSDASAASGTSPDPLSLSEETQTSTADADEISVNRPCEPSKSVAGEQDDDDSATSTAQTDSVSPPSTKPSPAPSPEDSYSGPIPTTTKGSIDLSALQIQYLIAINHPNITTHFFASFLMRDHCLMLIDKLVHNYRMQDPNWVGRQAPVDLSSPESASMSVSRPSSVSFGSMIVQEDSSAHRFSTSSPPSATSSDTDKRDVTRKSIIEMQDQRRSRSASPLKEKGDANKHPSNGAAHENDVLSAPRSSPPVPLSSTSDTSAASLLPPFILRPRLDFGSFVPPEDDFSGLEWDELIDLTVRHVNAEQFFNLFLSDTAPLSLPVYAEQHGRGDTDWKWSSWFMAGTNKPVHDIGCKLPGSTKEDAWERDVSYSKNVNSPLGPPSTRVHQIASYTADGSSSKIETRTLTPDVPFGENFIVMERIELLPVPDSLPSNPAVRVRTSVAIRFLRVPWKMKLLLGVIKSRTKEDVKAWYEGWIKATQLFIEQQPHLVQAVSEQAGTSPLVSPIAEVEASPIHASPSPVASSVSTELPSLPGVGIPVSPSHLAALAEWSWLRSLLSSIPVIQSSSDVIMSAVNNMREVAHHRSPLELVFGVLMTLTALSFTMQHFAQHSIMDVLLSVLLPWRLLTTLLPSPSSLLIAALCCLLIDQHRTQRAMYATLQQLEHGRRLDAERAHRVEQQLNDLQQSMAQLSAPTLLKEEHFV